MMQVCAVFVLLSGATVFMSKVGIKKQQFGFFRRLLKDPFTWLALGLLILYRVVLDYMEYKVELVTLERSSVSLLNRQKAVPELYRKIYGADLLLRLWRFRFMYIASAFIAVSRWMYQHR